jgi:hypothetical protein
VIAGSLDRGVWMVNLCARQTGERHGRVVWQLLQRPMCGLAFWVFSTVGAVPVRSLSTAGFDAPRLWQGAAFGANGPPVEVTQKYSHQNTNSAKWSSALAPLTIWAIFSKFSSPTMRIHSLQVDSELSRIFSRHSHWSNPLFTLTLCSFGTVHLELRCFFGQSEFNESCSRRTSHPRSSENSPE